MCQSLLNVVLLTSLLVSLWLCKRANGRHSHKLQQTGNKGQHGYWLNYWLKNIPYILSYHTLNSSQTGISVCLTPLHVNVHEIMFLLLNITTILDITKLTLVGMFLPHEQCGRRKALTVDWLIHLSLWTRLLKKIISTNLQIVQFRERQEKYQ